MTIVTHQIPPLPPSPTRKVSTSNTANTNTNSMGFFLPMTTAEEQQENEEHSDVATNPRTLRQQTHPTKQHILAHRKDLIHLQRQVAAWYSRFTQELLLSSLSAERDYYENDYDAHDDAHDNTTNTSHDNHALPFATKRQVSYWNQVMNRMEHKWNQLIFSNEEDSNTQSVLSSSSPSSSSKVPRIRSLQQRLNQIETTLRQESFLLLILNQIHHDTAFTMHLTETSKQWHALQIQSNKRHEQMYAKLRHIASLAQTSLADTNAQRYAQCTLLQETIQRCSNMNQVKREFFLQQIQQLKEEIQKEQQERMKRDEEIISMIVSHRTMLEKVMMLCLDL
jgi:hypothetical protein